MLKAHLVPTLPQPWNQPGALEPLWEVELGNKIWSLDLSALLLQLWCKHRIDTDEYTFVYLVNTS